MEFQGLFQINSILMNITYYLTQKGKSYPVLFRITNMRSEVKEKKTMRSEK